MKKIMLVAVATLGVVGFGWCDGESSQYTAVSPDGKNTIRLMTRPLSYEVLRDGEVMVSKTPIGLKVNGRYLGRGQKDPVVTSRRVSKGLVTPIYKKHMVLLDGNETFVDFGDWGVRLAARNDGVAYRFETKKQDKIRVDYEKSGITVPKAYANCWPLMTTSIGCEETVGEKMLINKAGVASSDKKVIYLPFVYSVGEKVVAVTESDVYDYPIWNLKGQGYCKVGYRFDPVFAKWPLKQAHVANVGGWSNMVESDKGGRWVRVKESADYLVVTDGTRTFPWRTFIVADAPAKLCDSDAVYALARPQASYDFSWVKPGKVAWDWWNAWDNKGEKDGCTTETYKRFIDFASKNGVEYVILDEGWSKALNIWEFSPNVDVPEIIRYGKKKNVGIILWMAWAQVYGDEERVANHFSKLGAKGFKVDFMDRGDAEVERFLWKFADACAKTRMVVDYHGAHRPTGMQRAYPNVLNFEGVHGLECMKFYRGEDFMENDLHAFFIRMTAGPMDYTPGAMDNYPIGGYKGNGQNPGSMGTRCRQMAMMTMYEAPLQMLSDAPTKYEQNGECFKFMAETPVTWDNTFGISGWMGQFAVIARRKGNVVYVAGMTNKDARDFTLNTKFLGKGEWKAEVFSDAPDADSEPAKYVHETGKVVKAGDKLPFHMAPGGGFVVKFTK